MSHKYSLVHLTCISCPPPEFIRTAAAAGYDYVSLRTIPMGLPNEVPHLLTDRVLLKETRAASLETDVKINDTENARIFDGVNVQEYAPHLAAAAELGIKHILCNVWTANRSFYTKKFAELCQLAAQFDQDINLEFVTWAGITNLEQAAQLLRDVDLPNVGIVVDALHFHRSRVKLEELESLPKEWFRFMHLCDAVQEIPTDLDVLVHDGREERLYPGEGAIDLKGILSKLPENIVRGIEIPHSVRTAEIGFEAHARRALEYAKKYLE